MLISLNWLSDFVDLPSDLDAAELADRVTLTCAEVEDVQRITTGQRTAAEVPATIDDWVIEIENKSITHRPDLWGHYGIAREVAAMLERPLKELEVAEGEELDDESLPEIPIEIDDPRACPRYSGIRLEGVAPVPSPAVMQARLANVGLRPINALVDLTNYVMAELGQPLHAFDGDKIERIEVAVSPGKEKFMTLDGFERTLPAGAVMIQAQRRNVALAGIMGGLDTEVTGMTRSILLEAATFDAASIRRAAAAMGHRTEASTRFEKSLDPALPVLAIGRFVHLARKQFPDLKLTSRLSDCFPHPPEPRHIAIDPGFISDFIGKRISLAKMKGILERLEFKVEDHKDRIEVLVPSFRATKDIECEADVIEEIARFVGYGNIAPCLPQVTVRHFAPNAIHRLEQRTLQLLCLAEGYHEIHDYNWYHEDWLKRLGCDSGGGITLRNPPASGLGQLRQTLTPGLLSAAELNRREFPTLKLINVASTFVRPGGAAVEAVEGQSRHLGLLSMTRGKKAEDGLVDELKGSLAKWSQELFGRDLAYTRAEPQQPWEHPGKSAVIELGDQAIGRITVLPVDLRRRIDEHFVAWSVALAEIALSDLTAITPEVRKLPAIPAYPTVELDFSVLADSGRAYDGLCRELAGFDHPLLQRLSFEGSYEGSNLPPGKRSVLLRLRIGDPQRTLGEEDIKSVGQAFEEFLQQKQLAVRR